MPVDPSDPDTFEDTYEDEPEGVRFDAPVEDTAEQHAELLRQRHVPITERGHDEADPADAAEQARVVEENEDEYR